MALKSILVCTKRTKVYSLGRGRTSRPVTIMPLPIAYNARGIMQAVFVQCYLTSPAAEQTQILPLHSDSLLCNRPASPHRI